MHFWLQVAWYALEVKDVRKTLETLETNLDVIWPYCLLLTLEAGAVQIIRRSRRTRKEIRDRDEARERSGKGRKTLWKTNHNLGECHCRRRLNLTATTPTDSTIFERCLSGLDQIYSYEFQKALDSSPKRSLLAAAAPRNVAPKIRVLAGYLSTRSFSHRDILGDVPELSDGRG